MQRPPQANQLESFCLVAPELGPEPGLPRGCAAKLFATHKSRPHGLFRRCLPAQWGKSVRPRKGKADLQGKSAAATPGTASSPSQACHADITLSRDGLGHILTQRGGGADRPPCHASVRTGKTRRSGELSASRSNQLPLFRPTGRSASHSGCGFGARERDGSETRGRAWAQCPTARFRGASEGAPRGASGLRLLRERHGPSDLQRPRPRRPWGVVTSSEWRR